ncbi:hypothetical protein [Hydrogenophaga sp.]|uniref:hypothetical protein n=1 Tax=Hydrogenophaga sp. TaxID=1904254 RepID=UPI00271AED7B|nr:hypothetical protein [Hydrogenophaga sp.]MDO8904735.1 hypothetical protein [Hydrogenophaga sp.]
MGAAHWIAMDGWTLEESALLLSGANPKRIEVLGADPHVAKPDLQSCGYVGINDRLLRASEMGVLSFPASPFEVCSWAAKKEQGIPIPLMSVLSLSTESTRDEAHQNQPVAPVVAADGCNLPEPVTTGAVAHALAGLRGWNAGMWKKKLGSPPKWLRDCIVAPGQRGVREHCWNPVKIGAALVYKGHAAVNSVRAKFQTRPELAPWLEAWKTYEANHFDAS